MTGEKGYTGIDGFRLIAAALVVAIHTSPLLLWGETADFVLTGVIARIAVPFFFMTSGFFLFAGRGGERERLKSLLGKTAKIYGFADAVLSAAECVYRLFFDRAAAADTAAGCADRRHGVSFVVSAGGDGRRGDCVGAARRGGFRLAFPVTLVLYAAGLLGDSYYGLAQGLPPLAWLYDRLFEVCDYTRNGLLFAPLFFVMGGWFARRRPERGTGVLHFCAFLLALAAMVAEGLLLRSLGMPRHDSMYVLLPVCLFFLFSWLSGLRGRRLPLVRTAALLVYILHPMVIGSGALCREIHRSDRTVGGQHLCAFFDGHGVVDGGGVRAWRPHSRPGGAAVRRGREYGRRTARGSRWISGRSCIMPAHCKGGCRRGVN